MSSKEISDMTGKEIKKDIAVDIFTGMVENVDTLLDPNASNADKFFTVADILIGIDFKGKNVGNLAQIRVAAQKQASGKLVKKCYLDTLSKK